MITTRGALLVLVDPEVATGSSFVAIDLGPVVPVDMLRRCERIESTSTDVLHLFDASTQPGSAIIRDHVRREDIVEVVIPTIVYREGVVVLEVTNRLLV